MPRLWSRFCLETRQQSFMFFSRHIKLSDDKLRAGALESGTSALGF